MKRIHVTAFTVLAGLGLFAVETAQAKCSPIASSGKNWQPAYVYFETGKSALSAEARKTIADQAKIAKAQFVQTICLTGTADKKGDPKVNERLSRARASAVASELVKQGIPRGAIETEGLGEPGGNLLSSAGGARADRRVEIRFTR